MTGVPTVLDERFRAAAAASGDLDVAYDLLDDTPIGSLIVGVSELGLCRVGFDPEPEVELEEGAAGASCRIRWGFGWWRWRLTVPSSSFLGVMRSRWISGWLDGARAPRASAYAAAYGRATEGDVGRRRE